MKPAAFDYYRPATLGEALDLLGEYGDEAKVLAGGQSLVPAMNMRLARPAALIDINRLTDESGIVTGDGALAVGPLVRQSELERRPQTLAQVPLLAHALPYIGHRQTRNRGTVCGSLAHADPAAELPLVIVALAGTLVVRSARAGTRAIEAADFFESYFTTALQPDELLVEARFPAHGAGWGFAFEEFAERHGDFAVAAVACAVAPQGGNAREIRLVFGGVSDRPHAVTKANCAGRLPTEADLDEFAASAASELDPPSDRRGSGAYRSALARTLARRALERALERAQQNGASS